MGGMTGSGNSTRALRGVPPAPRSAVSPRAVAAPRATAGRRRGPPMVGGGVPYHVFRGQTVMTDPCSEGGKHPTHWVSDRPGAVRFVRGGADLPHGSARGAAARCHSGHPSPAPARPCLSDASILHPLDFSLSPPHILCVPTPRPLFPSVLCTNDMSDIASKWPSATHRSYY